MIVGSVRVMIDFDEKKCVLRGWKLIRWMMICRDCGGIAMFT